MKNLFYIFIIFSLQTSFAVEKKIRDLGTSKIEVRFYDDSLTQKDSEKIRSVLKKVDDVLGICFEIPKYYISLYQEGPNFYRKGRLGLSMNHGYLPSSFEIWMQDVYIKALDKKLAGTEIINPTPVPIWMHEYGHAYFDYALRKTNSRWKKWQSEIYNFDSPPIQSLVRPYNEFFADAVSVVLTEDLNAMENSFEKMDRPDPSNEFRKFEGNLENIKNLQEPFSIDGAYEGLAPTRLFVGEKFTMKKNYTNQEKCIFLKSIFNAISDEIKDRDKGTYDFEFETVESVNTSLQKRMNFNMIQKFLNPILHPSKSHG